MTPKNLLNICCFQWNIIGKKEWLQWKVHVDFLFLSLVINTCWACWDRGGISNYKSSIFYAYEWTLSIAGGTSPKGRRKLNFVEKKEKLPLNGKSIFVDVKEKSQCRSIKEDIKRLGAVDLWLLKSYLKKYEMWNYM